MNICAVLVIEGDLSFRTLLQEALKLRRLAVCGTAFYTEALGFLQHYQIDLILCELDLPEGDGYSLLRQWRTYEAAQGQDPIPAIAMSNLEGLEHESQALAAGFQAYLQKPFGIDALHTMIKQVLASN